MNITTQFNIGDKVYFMHDNEVHLGTVSEIHVKVDTIQTITFYKIVDREDDSPLQLGQKLLFSTKQDLLNSL